RTCLVQSSVILTGDCLLAVEAFMSVSETNGCLLNDACFQRLLTDVQDGILLLRDLQSGKRWYKPWTWGTSLREITAMSLVTFGLYFLRLLVYDHVGFHQQSLIKALEQAAI